MIVFPAPFVKVPDFPGYYWHTSESRLYSIKIDGVLKPLKVQKAYSGPAGRKKFGRYVDLPERYNLYKNGRRYVKSVRSLSKLSVPKEFETVDIKV